MKKLKVAVIFGGTNTEHEVSLVSARSIMNHLDPQEYSILPIKITKNNQWLSTRKLYPSIAAIEVTNTTKDLITIQPQQISTIHKIDVVFPVIHGPFGEDGTLQGLLELMHVPYVGCGVLSSALCMDKVVQKQLCLTHQIPIPDFVHSTNYYWKKHKLAVINDCEYKLSYPCFVKPANQGSSIGVTKTSNRSQLKQAIKAAFKLDTKVIIEKAVPHAREIECAVLGNHQPKSSVLGEVIPSNEFYDYDAKYIDGKSREIVPTKLPDKTSDSIRQTAVKAFKILDCSGLARIDFLVEKGTNKYYLNELNTMPGFTSISMYPKLWLASGLTYPKLLDNLISFALETHQEKSHLNLSYVPKTSWHTN